MSFEDNSHLRIVNKGGVDCIYNFFTGCLKNAAMIDNFRVNVWNYEHYHFDPVLMSPSDTLGRLTTVMDSTKVLQSQIKKFAHELEMSKAH